MGKSAEIPDLVWGETKSIPCITLQKPQAKTLAPTKIALKRERSGKPDLTCNNE